MMDLSLYNFNTIEELICINGNDGIDDDLGSSFLLCCTEDTLKLMKGYLKDASKVKLYEFDEKYQIYTEVAIYDKAGDSTSLNLHAIRFENHEEVVDSDEDITELLEFIDGIEYEKREYDESHITRNGRHYSESTFNEILRGIVL